MKTITIMDGDKVSVGDFIGFKNDIEMTGRVVEIKHREIVASVYDSVTGERTNWSLDPSRCWAE